MFTKIAAALGVTARFVGEEPTSVVTGAYNRIMREELPKAGIECVVVPRKTAGETVISASTVRRALQTGDSQTLEALVPPTTWNWLQSPAAVPVVERIRRTNNVVHY